MSPIDRAFNVLMWIIIGAIVFVLFVPGGKNFLSVFSTAWAGFNGSLSIITGQSTKYT